MAEEAEDTMAVVKAVMEVAEEGRASVLKTKPVAHTELPHLQDTDL